MFFRLTKRLGRPFFAPRCAKQSAASSREVRAEREVFRVRSILQAEKLPGAKKPALKRDRNSCFLPVEMPVPGVQRNSREGPRPLYSAGRKPPGAKKARSQTGQTPVFRQSKFCGNAGSEDPKEHSIFLRIQKNPSKNQLAERKKNAAFRSSG